MVDIETIDDLDEVKILGYFETIQGTFLLKLCLLGTVLKTVRGVMRLDPSIIDRGVLAALKKHYPGESTFFRALDRGNPELRMNLHEDIVSSLHIQSWIVFEQIIRHLSFPNYAHDPKERSLSYKRSIFEFSSREKKDLDLFYYLRNSLLHYNGAYYASKDIRHRYNGLDFNSKGNEGIKMPANIDTVWLMSKDLERLACQAWTKTR